MNKYARSAKGFLGYISLFSCDQDNVAIILTTWDDDESYSASKELFSSGVNKLVPFFEKQPDVEHCRVDTVNLSNISPSI